MAYRHKEVQGAKEAITVGCAFLLREIEVAAIRSEHLVAISGPGCGSVSLLVEASKTDGAAEGVTRTLACTCPAMDCPVKAAMSLKQGRQPYQYVVRTRTGQAVSKETMVDAIKGYAELLGQENVSRVTGHSMRVTGAQRLLRAGLPLGQVQLFGRWHTAGEALRYLRDTAINKQILREAMVRTSGRPKEPGATKQGPSRRWEKVLAHRR